MARYFANIIPHLAHSSPAASEYPHFGQTIEIPFNGMSRADYAANLGRAKRGCGVDCRKSFKGRKAIARERLFFYFATDNIMDGVAGDAINGVLNGMRDRIC